MAEPKLKWVWRGTRCMTLKKKKKKVYPQIYKPQRTDKQRDRERQR